MNRRSFLRGTLLSTAGATGLIKFASSDESKLLVPKRELIIGHAVEHSIPWGGDSREVYMRRNDGGFECIGDITQVVVHSPCLEYTSWEGTVRMYDPGIRSGIIYFEGKG